MTVQYLSDQWCCEIMEVASGKPFGIRDSQVVTKISGSPSGALQLSARFRNGSLESLELGSGDDPDPISLKVTYSQAVQIGSGELDPTTLFMIGDLKTEGSTGPLIDLLHALSTDSARAAISRLAKLTDFS